MTRYLTVTHAQILLLAGTFALVFQHTLTKLFREWSLNPDFSHGFLIPFISIYMIWQKRESLLHKKVLPANSGLVILLMGMVMHIAGNIGAELFTMRVATIVTLYGMVVFVLGWDISRGVFVPFAYLFFMVPIPSIIWNQVSFPLQLFAAESASDVIFTLGISVFREGNILHLANTSLQVVDACSGLRSLTSLLALGGAFAYVTNLKTALKWTLFLSAIPISVIVNIIRLTATAVMAVYISPETAQGFLHDLSGVVVFVVAFCLLYMVYALLDRTSHCFDDAAKDGANR